MIQFSNNKIIIMDKLTLQQIPTMRKAIEWAEERKVAVGHFNVSDSTQVHAIVEAAMELNVPIIIGASGGERKFIGVKQVAAIVKSLREEHDYPIFLNADHTYSYEGVVEAIDAGFDSVIFDSTKVGHDKNLEMTKKCVEYAKECGREVLVEAEMGNIGQSSSMWDEAPAEVDDDVLTDPAMLKKFVEETGVNLIAPAVGNLHGMSKDGRNPELNLERVKELREAGGIPMVLHGGSGISEDDFKEAIKLGMSIVHINTAIRKAYHAGIKDHVNENPDDIAPYKYMAKGKEMMKQVVIDNLKMFNMMD